MTDEIHFGRFGLNLAQGGLLRDGKLVPLGNRALEILIVLASAKGEIVTKDELMAQVWPGRVVEENNIQVHVSALRKALDDGSTNSSCVVTVPGRGYRLIGIPPPASVDRAAAEPVPEAAEHPSIAVLPFRNMSDDPDQDHFTDGMVEEIITGLSRFRWLSVIARNSSFAYKGRAMDVQQIGRELGVRYVLEGSVRKAADRVRIAGQLIYASNGAHLWADCFEGSLRDAFDLQDRVTATVIGAVAPRLEQAEVERAARKPSENLDAYDHYLRGIASLRRETRPANDEALRLFYRAIELDADFSSAYGMAAWCYCQRQSNGWIVDREQAIAEVTRLADGAAKFGKHDAVALCWSGHALAYVTHAVEAGAALIQRALILNPNLAAAWDFSGWVNIWLGKPEVAIEHFAHAIRLNPLGVRMGGKQARVACAHLCAGRYDDASSWAEAALGQDPNFAPALQVAAASNALAGRFEAAQNAVRRLRELDPAARISSLRSADPAPRLELFARLEEGLRKAGMPD
jgi:TolB-like protein